MRVIGTTNTGFMLEASEHEIANLVGYLNTYAMRDHRGSRTGGQIQVGDDIQVSKMFGRLYQLAQHEGKLNEARAILRTVSEGIGIVVPIIREVATEEEASRG